MALRGSAPFSCSYIRLYGALSTNRQINKSPFPHSPLSTPAAGSAARSDRLHRRGYASVVGEHGPKKKDIDWPNMPVNAIPTPYQIFKQQKGAPYSKDRFYELVKLYHPDRNGRTETDSLNGCGVCRAVMLERYRLIVRANNILSDPVKRRAYDRYGAGWNGLPEVRSHRDTNGNWENPAWGGRGSPSQNATWEDWERWYRRDAKQEPRIFSNSVFVSLIIILAALGTIGQASRAGNYSLKFVNERDHLHDKMSKELMKRRRETTSKADNRDERIQNFMRMRDPVGYGVTDPLEEGYRRLFPPPEVCSSGDIQERQMDVYHKENSGQP